MCAKRMKEGILFTSHLQHTTGLTPLTQESLLRWISKSIAVLSSKVGCCGYWNCSVYLWSHSKLMETINLLPHPSDFKVVKLKYQRNIKRKVWRQWWSGQWRPCYSSILVIWANVARNRLPETCVLFLLWVLNFNIFLRAASNGVEQTRKCLARKCYRLLWGLAASFSQFT